MGVAVVELAALYCGAVPAHPSLVNMKISATHFFLAMHSELSKKPCAKLGPQAC
jgi:hypothetical protein